MRKLATLAVALLVLIAMAMPAVAQAEPGDVGVFFDLAGTASATNLAQFAVSNFYVMGFGLGDLTGFELNIGFSRAGWSVLARTLPTASSLNVGSGDNFIVGLGSCVTPSGVAPYTLVNYQYGWFAPTVPGETLMCVGPSTPSSFAGLPGYSSCNDVLKSFGAAQNGAPNYPNGCGVVNPLSGPPVATENVSFGAVKASF